MKQSKLTKNKSLKDIFLILSILLGFIFILSFSIIYVSDAIKNNNACGCVIPIPYMILLLSSMGLFVGCFSSYFLIAKQIKENKEINKNIEITLGFLDKNERSIVKELIKNKGRLNQSEFEKVTGLNRVKVHRILQKLLSKGLVEKTSIGKSNVVQLREELKSIFV